MTRDQRQRAVYEWATQTFGPGATLPSERVLRLLEEAVELAQAERLPLDRALAVVHHVYGKPAGLPENEAGDVGVTLLAYCESVGLSADGLETMRFAAAQERGPEQMRARQTAKAAAGIGIKPEDR